jgi:biopolymer transport protein ExbB/TolQ
MAKWKQQDNKAFLQITLNMEDGVMNNIVDKTSANKAWTRIVERWEGKGMQSQSFLYQQLMSTKNKEEEDLTTRFNLIKSTVSKIKTLGESILYKKLICLGALRSGPSSMGLSPI